MIRFYTTINALRNGELLTAQTNEPNDERHLFAPAIVDWNWIISASKAVEIDLCDRLFTICFIKSIREYWFPIPVLQYEFRRRREAWMVSFGNGMHSVIANELLQLLRDYIVWLQKLYGKSYNVCLTAQPFEKSPSIRRWRLFTVAGKYLLAWNLRNLMCCQFDSERSSSSSKKRGLLRCSEITKKLEGVQERSDVLFCAVKSDHIGTLQMLGITWIIEW